MQGRSFRVCSLDQTPDMQISEKQTGVPAHSAIAELVTCFGICCKDPFRKPDLKQHQTFLWFSLDQMPAVWIS